jgi:outer membrane receptor protein involved in Fe transport
VRLRASYNRAIRAPNIAELFRAQAGNVSLDDPCAGATPDRLGQRLRGNRRGRIKYGTDHPVPGRYLLVDGRRQSR